MQQRCTPPTLGSINILYNQILLRIFAKIKLMDISKITDSQAKAFIEQFLRDRRINKEFYKRIPEDKFDFRMVPMDGFPRV